MSVQPKTEEVVNLDLEEDDFEEFEDCCKGVVPMTGVDTKEKPKGMFDQDDDKKWDDDDIDELFPSLLKQEIKFTNNQYVAPVGFAAELTLQKSRARQEAELLEREKMLAEKEFAIHQRKKALDGLTDALRNPEAKALKNLEKKVTGTKEVDQLFKQLQDEEGSAGDEEKYNSVASAEFGAWLDQSKAKAKFSAFDLREREVRLVEREKDLKMQERSLDESRTKMKRTRRASVVKMMAPNVTATELEEKETEETTKVLAVRQSARRRASIHAAYEQAKVAGIEKAQELIEQAAANVAQAEETEEAEMYSLGKEEDTEAKVVFTSKGSNLPYKPHQGDRVDEAVATAINNAKLDIAIKLLPATKKRGGNKNMYQLANGKKIIVRVIHKVAVASLRSGPNTWIPIIKLLKKENGL